MDLSRLKKVLAGISVAAISAGQVVPAFAATAQYRDVPSGVWYEESVMKFVEDGLLDASQMYFRGGDNANRAEFVKLLVMMNGGLLSTPPAVGSFNDVATSSWYYAYMEEAAKEGWVKGDGNCYGTKPCYARPSANINRAEAAALIVRAFGLEATGEASQFVDVPNGAWYTDAVQTAADHCVLQGNNGMVRPSDNMNRSEMVVMLHRVDQGLSYGVDCGVDAPTEAGIRSATATGLRTVEVVFSTALDQTTAEMASHYSVTGATPAVTVTAAKLVSDDTVELTVSGDLATSGDYTVTATDVETTDGDVFSDSADFGGYNTLPTSNGTLQVSVASKNPVGDTVPKGANGVTFLSLDLTASCDDAVTVEDLVVLKEGFGDENDLSGVYAAINGGRISRKRTIDSKDQTARIHLTKPLTVPACKTVTVDLMGDFTTTAAVAAEHNLAVELPSDFSSNAKQVTGNFPLRGNTFRVGAVTSGTLTITYRSVTPNEVEVGNTNVVLGRFEVGASTVEDTTLYSVTIQQDGSAKDGDITNLKVRRTDGTVISNVVTQTVGDYATFVFDPPFTVLEGSKITLEIVGDVVGGAGNNAKLLIEETGDVFAVGSLYGYGVNGQLYGSQITISTSVTPATVTIDAGQFTIEVDGPVQQRYNRDQNDANLANIIMTPGDEEIDLRKLFILVQGFTATGLPLDGVAATAANTLQSGSYDDINEVINNVQLFDKATGRSVTGVRLTSAGFGKTAGYGTYQIYRFDDFTVKGKATYELRADFVDNGSANHPTDGDQFRIHLCGEPTERNNTTNATGCTFGGAFASTTAYQMQVEGLSSTDKVQDVRPGGTISGNIHRISSASMTIAVKPLLSSDTTVKNAKNVNLLRFEARAGEAKDVLFTKAVFVAGGATNLQNGQNYTLWADSDSDGNVDTIVEDGVTTQSSKITFAKFKGGGFVIPKEKTVVFELHSNIATSPVSSTLQVAFDTAASDYVEAEQVDRGTNLSGIRTNGTCATNCDITVTTVASTLFTIVNQGNLYVSKDTVSLRNKQLLGGTVSDSVLRLNARAEYEDIDVYSLQLTSSGAAANTVDSLDLYIEGKTTPFATARVADCGSDDVLTSWYGATVRTFCAKMQSSQLVVPKGSDIKILVKPRLNSDESGALSQEVIQFFVTKQAVFDNTTGSGAVRARGRQSSNDLIANNGNGTADGEVFIGRTAVASTNQDIDGIKNVSALSKIKSITNAGQSSNVVPTGQSDIAWFKVAAETNVNSKNGLNKATLSGVVFNVTATNVALDATSFVFYNSANSTITKPCTAKLPSGSVIGGTASGSFVVQCDSLTTGSNPPNTAIDQGTDQTFVIKADVTNPKVLSTSTSTLQVSLQNFDSISRTTYGPGSTDTHIQWVDQDSGTIGTGTTTSSIFQWVEYGETTVKSTSFTQ